MNIKRCHIWYCFRKSWRGLEIELGGIKKVVAWYCKKHAELADEAFKNNEIKTDIPITEYKGL